MNLATKLESIKGVGSRTAAQLHAAGLETVGDLITFLPRKHEDFSAVVAIGDVRPGKQTIKARCEHVEVKRVRRGMTVTTATLADDTGKLQAVWFNQPYRAEQLLPKRAASASHSGAVSSTTRVAPGGADGGSAVDKRRQSARAIPDRGSAGGKRHRYARDEFFFSGDFEFRYNRYQLTNPSAEKVSDLPLQTDRILPIYRQVKGLKSQVVRKILGELRPLMTVLPETLPASVVASEKLVSYSDAIVGLHFPKSAEDIARARERLGFEELFQLLLASQLNRQANATLEGVPIPFDSASVKKFVADLPFKLTNAQRVAAWEIIQDFEKTTPMNRLLQGDVGSGKTVVAGIAALQAAQAGFQTAIMAPTEILARQHANTLSTLLEPFGITVGLLISSVKGKARAALTEQISGGSIAVTVGTHALIQDSVTFHKLGFVVIDEQHRFGVAQRQALLAKAVHMPHLLAMTATPIPRSLQLTVFGELDISVLNERPANRKPIKTSIVNPVSAKNVYAAIDQQIQQGRQAYVICSLIDDSPTSDKKSVEAEYKKLKNSVFGHRSIAMLHGRMKADEKDQIMQDFKDKKYDILVSTTVVEVGVDVPNATVIMIENSDQFGLAQLHQLRGRVGRGDEQSYCYLMMSDSKKPSERLRELEKSNDGFYLAEVDLRLRGPGEIYGRMQHGDLNLQIATLADTRQIKRAQKAAEQFITSGKSLLQYKQLAVAVEKYQRLTTLN